MKKPFPFLALVAAAYVAPVASESVEVTLADYAFDFATIGYEITVSGETGNIQDALTADDYISIEADGYTLKTLIDRMNRKDRQQFIRFFNKHCIVGFVGPGCAITASGDIELDENMKMIFRMSTAKIAMGAARWSNEK